MVSVIAGLFLVNGVVVRITINLAFFPVLLSSQLLSFQSPPEPDEDDVNGSNLWDWNFLLGFLGNHS